MSVYREVPNWWYLTIFGSCAYAYRKELSVLISSEVSMFVLGVVAIEVWETQLPIWTFVLALGIRAFTKPDSNSFRVLIFICSAFIFIVPIGVIQAMTNQQVGLNVITELIVGYILPGRPTAMMLFKTWGYVTMIQALAFTSDFKLGHYMKIPHRPMFWCQIVATVVAGTVQLAVQAWMFSNIKDICSPDQPDGFTCPNTTVFGTASIIVSYRSTVVVFIHFLNCVVIVGCHRTTAVVLPRPTLSRSHILLPPRHPCAIDPMGNPQEAQTKLPEVHQLPSHLCEYGVHAPCDASQLHTLGTSLFHLQL
jgi:OPT family oligopeptide transporter